MAERRSFGQVRKLPSGRFQARFRRAGVWHTAKALDGSPRTFTTEKQAGNWLAAQQEAIANGSWTPPGKPQPKQVTFQAFADDWLANRRHPKRGTPLKPLTRKHYRELLDNVILDDLGEKAVRDVDQDAVEAWWYGLSTEHPTRNAHAYALLRSILVTARKRKLITEVPTIDGAGVAKRRRPIRPLDLDELAALVARMPEKYRLMVLLYAWCALRFGELTALRRKHINIKRGIVYVDRGVTRTRGEWHEDTPKAGEADQVAIPPHILPEVKTHVADLKPDDLLFPSTSGGYMQLSSFHKVFRNAKTKIGRDDIRPHDLRHLGSLLAAQAGASPAELMQRLRHKTAQASQIYWHAAQESDLAIAKRMSEMATTQTNVVSIEAAKKTRKRKEAAG